MGIEAPGPADSGSASNATMDFTLVLTRDGMATTLAPGWSSPEPSCPANPRKLASGRITYCTENNNGREAEPSPAGIDSRCSSSGGPSNQGIRLLRLTTLSPSSALTG